MYVKGIWWLIGTGAVVITAILGGFYTTATFLVENIK